MIIQNLTRRSSKAMLLLSQAHDELSPLLHVIKGEDNLKQLFNGMTLMEDAMKELIKIIAQDNRVTNLEEA